MKLFVCRIDDNRDRILCERLESFLGQLRQGDHLQPMVPPDLPPTQFREETERLLGEADGLICLYSLQAASSQHVQLQLHLASKRAIPVVILEFPGVQLPDWMDDTVRVVLLEGFKDSGPSLPPSTDEWEILSESTFVRSTLTAFREFLDDLREGGVGCLPPVPPPIGRPAGAHF